MPDLLNTSNVPLAPHATTTETVLPDWYTNYAMQILSNQKAVSSNPYPTYGSPRIADFTSDQQAGFEATRGAAGSYQPGMQAATGAVGALAGVNPSAAANPWLARSGVTSASQVGQYMSPYIDQVVDRIGALGNRNFTENLMPAIGDQFVSAGGYGGSRQAEAIGRAARDTQEGITAAQAGALDSGYRGSLSAAGTDLQRYGALGSTALEGGRADVDSGIRVGGALSDLAGRQQSLGLGAAGALQQIGGMQQDIDQKNLDVGFQDFLRQQGYDQTQIDAMTRTMQGVAGGVPKSTLETGYGPAQTTGSTSTAGAIAAAIGALLLK